MTAWTLLRARAEDGRVIQIHAPGRVNLIGDHTDYAGGRALPMAIDLGITIRGERGGDRVELRSSLDEAPAIVPIDVDHPAAVEPAWARYVAGVVAEVQPDAGFRGTIESTLPMGIGLSSSAALEVAVALALGAAETHDALAVAQLCQRAEQRGSGVPCGLMDQLASVCGQAGHALLIDFAATTWTTIRIPDDLAVHVVPSGVVRSLATSDYAARRLACEAAAAELGPLGDALAADVERLRDPRVRRCARHVVSENERVAAMTDALTAGDLRTAGEILVAGHRSLRDDFAVSVPALDALVERLVATPGVHGARLTGAGFGGCAVAFTEPEADLSALGGWRVRPSAGAAVSRAGS
jgi:galactokinase